MHNHNMAFHIYFLFYSRPYFQRKLSIQYPLLIDLTRDMYNRTIIVLSPKHLLPFALVFCPMAILHTAEQANYSFTAEYAKTG